MQKAWEVEYAVLSDFGNFFRISLNALKAFIWALLVLVRPHFAFKVCGKWKYAFLSDFSTILQIPFNALKVFIWALLVLVRPHFAF